MSDAKKRRRIENVLFELKIRELYSRGPFDGPDSKVADRLRRFLFDKMKCEKTKSQKKLAEIEKNINGKCLDVGSMYLLDTKVKYNYGLPNYTLCEAQEELAVRKAHLEIAQTAREIMDSWSAP